MNILFETESGSSFAIRVDLSNTLLEVKQKIEKSQNIPVSKQTLVVDGAVILREDLSVQQCQIVRESHLQVLVSPEDNHDHNNDQVLQTEQSSAPLMSAEEHFELQGWPLTAEEVRKIYSYRPETDSRLSRDGAGKKQSSSSNRTISSFKHSQRFTS